MRKGRNVAEEEGAGKTREQMEKREQVKTRERKEETGEEGGQRKRGKGETVRRENAGPSTRIRSRRRAYVFDPSEASSPASGTVTVRINANPISAMRTMNPTMP